MSVVYISPSVLKTALMSSREGENMNISSLPKEGENKQRQPSKIESCLAGVSGRIHKSRRLVLVRYKRTAPFSQFSSILINDYMSAVFSSSAVRHRTNPPFSNSKVNSIRVNTAGIQNEKYICVFLQLSERFLLALTQKKAKNVIV